jgi:hypothetical protein
MRKWTIFVIAALAILPESIYGQANLTFSGGNGTDLTVTLNAPISFVYSGPATSTYFQQTPLYFEGLNIQFSAPYINNYLSLADSAPPTPFEPSNKLPLDRMTTVGGNFGLYSGGELIYVNPGDVLTLPAGSFTTAYSVSGATPANGVYTAILSIDGTSINGVSPEPPSFLLLVAGVVVLIFGHLRITRSRSV